ncbi:MAG TPA: potassium transporter KefB [Fibrobacteres bacterium]|nr:potassium transporter KefB [Fibrobacterota bacterium]
MQTAILSSIVVIFGLSIGVLFLCYRLHIPTVVGFLLTGIIFGPHGLRLVNESQNVEILAQFGVVLLLFTIGIEFSLKNLLAIKRNALIGGSMQVVMTIAVVAIICIHTGRSVAQSVLLGFIISLSSTAIVLKRLQEKAEVESPHGRMILAILIYQDLIVVPMMLLLQFFSKAKPDLWNSIGMLLLKMAIICIVMFAGGKWIIPKILFQAAKTRSREIFLLTIIVICFSVALLTSSMGLSLALGAFLAGLLISESEYSSQALGIILPFRDVFTSVFFISIGMLFDAGYFFQRPLIVLSLAAGVILFKFFVAAPIPAILGFPLRTMVLVGIALAQIGEFSFILLQSGLDMHILDLKTYQTFLGVSILTMVAAPFILSSGNFITHLILKLPFPERMKSGIDVKEMAGVANNTEIRKDHLIIIGYGMNGRNVAKAAKAAGISYIILEMNPETVRKEKASGEPIHYGDATQAGVLHHINIAGARVIVVAIPDPVATRRVIEVARKISPLVHIIARTRFYQEMAPLYELGASEVVPEEFETSVEIFTRVLLNYLVPRENIERFIDELRSDSYRMFRSLSKQYPSLSDLKSAFADDQISTLRIHPNAAVVGKTLSEIDLRKKFGVTLLAIRRNKEILSNPSGETCLCPDDIIVLLGSSENTARVAYLMKDKSDEGKYI